MPQSVRVVCYTTKVDWIRDVKKTMSKRLSRPTFLKPCFNPTVFEFDSESNEEWLRVSKYDWYIHFKGHSV